jgi:hypothetical protein
MIKDHMIFFNDIWTNSKMKFLVGLSFIFAY